MNASLFSIETVADILSISKRNIKTRIKNGEMKLFAENLFHIKDLLICDEFKKMHHSMFLEEMKTNYAISFYG